MEQKLKELIQLSIVNGSISNEKREFIYSKAAENGIEKTECDILIDGFINNDIKNNTVIKDNKNQRGWVFFAIGVIDFIWLCSYMKSSGQYYGEDFGRIQFFSSLIFMGIGSYILGWLNKKSATRVGIVLASYLIPYLIFQTILYLIHIPIRAVDVHSLYEFEWRLEDFLGLINWIAFAIFIYMFKNKLFGEELSSKINFQFLDNKLNPIKNKLPDWLK